MEVIKSDLKFQINLYSGESYIQASLIPSLNNNLANRDIDKDKIDSLTTREMEVLQWMILIKG